MLYKDLELLKRLGDRTCEWGCCKATEWTIDELAFLGDFGAWRFWNRESAECRELQCILKLRHSISEIRINSEIR